MLELSDSEGLHPIERIHAAACGKDKAGEVHGVSVEGTPC